MILLIPEKAKTTATAKPDLNSIMILLIQVCFFWYSLCLVLFKFHYDSINSETDILFIQYAVQI